MAKTKKNGSESTSKKKKEHDLKCKKTKSKKNSKTNKMKKKRIERNYNVQSIKEALDAIDKGKSYREASESFGVPKTTLYRFKKSDNPELNSKKGAPTVFTASEEENFVAWILYRAERGFPVNKKLLLDTVKDYVMSTGRNNPFSNDGPGYKWYRLFMKRHSNLSIHSAQNLTTTRASVSESDLRQWFAKLKIYLEEKNLLNIDPKRIFNLDESSFMLVPPKNDAVITKKGARAIYKVVSGNEKSCLTVLFTVTASGQLLPPMILFDLKTTPRKEVLEKIPTDWAVGNTEKGWMTSESFYKYIVNVFYNWLVENGIEFPVILYADNHSSHLTMPLVKFCQEKQIELIGLYPNSTHIIQPLEVGLFHVLKDKYKEANDAWRIKNNVIDVKKHMFTEILKTALDSYNFSNCIVSGFRGCGLFPFNPDAVQYNILNKKKKKKKNSTAQNLEEVTAANSSSSNSDTFLQTFERKCLSSSILDDFTRNESNEFWIGDIKLEGLFETWRKLRGTSGK
ncbi:uncharacterized protein [Prorops nasuta]|uniref:uncharacterized protein n=1 Tax=Prorops nasuta TaxID=863751 RepID=UPI0034CEA215